MSPRAAEYFGPCAGTGSWVRIGSNLATSIRAGEYETGMRMPSEYLGRQKTTTTCPHGHHGGVPRCGRNGTMARDGRTGLVIPVAEADSALNSVAERYPDSVRKGIPAHVSVLYPFLPADRLDAEVMADLRTVLDAPSMRLSLADCVRHESFVYLRPRPDEPLRELTGAVCRRWPELVPYEGRYDVVEPHVTVAMATSERTAMAIEGEVAEKLPIRADLSEVWLVAFERRWTIRERFGLRT